MSMSNSSSLSSWVIVEVEELGLSSKSFSICCRFSRPTVDVSPVKVAKASSMVSGMYGSSLLYLLFCLILLKWLSSEGPDLTVIL